MSIICCHHFLVSVNPSHHAFSPSSHLSLLTSHPSALSRYVPNLLSSLLSHSYPSALHLISPSHFTLLSPHSLFPCLPVRSSHPSIICCHHISHPITRTHLAGTAILNVPRPEEAPSHQRAEFHTARPRKPSKPTATQRLRRGIRKHIRYTITLLQTLRTHILLYYWLLYRRLRLVLRIILLSFRFCCFGRRRFFQHIAYLATLPFYDKLLCISTNTTRHQLVLIPYHKVGRLTSLLPAPRPELFLPCAPRPSAQSTHSSPPAKTATPT